MDLPAAHSMDTSWFGVDCHGHIAKFDTSEDGGLPAYLEGDLDRFETWRLYAAAAGSDEDPEEEDLAELGLYHYRDDGQTLYRRQGLPARPVLLQDLPEEVREKMPAICLPEVSFADKPVLQIEEHVGRIDYYDERVWYASEDGARACAKKGAEAAFRARFRTGADWVPLQQALAQERQPAPSLLRRWWPLLVSLMLLVAALLGWLGAR